LRSALKDLPAIAAANDGVLITGETGTGKELCARAIHQLSSRAGRPLVAVNCANLTPELAANELFGHAAGSYTGATRRGEGLLKMTHGSTLLLDELNSLPIEAQGKLLRYFDHGEFNAIGSPNVTKVDVRIIAATNVDLKQCVCEGRFRQDLYYRIRQFTIDLPPLRARWEDIVPLAEHFLREISIEARNPPKRLSSAACAKLLAYSWPGNVRELRSATRKAAALCENYDIDETDIELDRLPEVMASMTLKAAVEVASREYFQRTLAQCRGNIVEVARAAGLPRSEIYRRLRDLRITISDFR
jgi:DNA-binding NtrC family response regulator